MAINIAREGAAAGWAAAAIVGAPPPADASPAALGAWAVMGDFNLSPKELRPILERCQDRMTETIRAVGIERDFVVSPMVRRA